MIPYSIFLTLLNLLNNEIPIRRVLCICRDSTHGERDKHYVNLTTTNICSFNQVAWELHARAQSTTLHTYGVTEDGRQLHSVTGSCHSQLFISMNLTQVSWAVAIGQISFMIDRSKPRLSLFEKSEITREKKFWKLKLQSTPDNSNLQGKSKKVLVIGSSKQITGSKEISKWMGRKGN